MNREELKDLYGDEICELCFKNFFTNRAAPETLCEGRYCEDAEEDFAEEHNIELKD